MRGSEPRINQLGRQIDREAVGDHARLRAAVAAVGEQTKRGAGRVVSRHAEPKCVRGKPAELGGLKTASDRFRAHS